MQDFLIIHFIFLNTLSVNIREILGILRLAFKLFCTYTNVEEAQHR